MSLAGEAAAQARAKANSTLGYYNFKLGPTAWRLSAGLDFAVTDNANLVQNSQGEGDFIVRPQANANMLWPLTRKNSLNLALGFGYSAYTVHPGLSQLFITPGSELSFDFFVSDFVINVHDRFSIMENSYQDPTVYGTGGYSQLQNAPGVSVLWDLNKIIARAGFDHVDYVDLGGANQRFQGQSENFFANAGYLLRPEMLVGLEGGTSLINYEQNLVNHAVQWNAGGFYSLRLTSNLDLRASAGYTLYSPEANGTSAVGTDISGAYFQLAMNHMVNRYLDYTLSAGRTISIALFGGTVDQYYIALQPNWKLLRLITITTPFTYYHGSQVDYGNSTFDWFNAGINFNRPITQKMTGGVGYQYVYRSSSLPGQNYTINTVTVSLRYAF